ncbi:MAG: hypothetical protein K2M82_01165 [Lachnospiraceae bacterium]|nr:hypothetical protein [Lachnospiraceae bacterium]
MDIKKLFEGIASDGKKRNIIIALGMIGILLIFMSSLIDGGKDENKVSNEPNDIVEQSVDGYKSELESELSEIISQIDGVGDVHLLLTMESTTEQVYAIEKNIDEQIGSILDDDKSSNETEYTENNTYVIVKSGDGSENLVKLKEVMPRIRGVLVVCEGGENAVVKEKVTKAVCGALNISSGKVCVTY